MVYGHLNRPVPHLIQHVGQPDTGLNQETAECMPQVVKTDSPQAGAREHGCKTRRRASSRGDARALVVTISRRVDCVTTTLISPREFIVEPENMAVGACLRPPANFSNSSRKWPRSSARYGALSTRPKSSTLVQAKLKPQSTPRRPWIAKILSDLRGDRTLARRNENARVDRLARPADRGQRRGLVAAAAGD